MEEIQPDAWELKYRPTKLDDLVLAPETRQIFEEYLKKETFMNCTLYGQAGIGKTCLAELIQKAIPDSTRLFINASAENKIEVVRNKIKVFTERRGFGGLKFVILDEMNRMTTDAQESLRTLILNCIDDTRFILTTNRLDAVIEPIQSRCKPILIKHPVKEIYDRLIYILEAENIEYSDDDRTYIIESIIKKQYPDVRAMVKHAEMCSISGKFVPVEYVIENKVKEILDFVMKNKRNVFACREKWIKNETEFNKDYTYLANKLFDMVTTAEEMEIIAEHLYRMSVVLDKEIQFTSMIIGLSKV